MQPIRATRFRWIAKEDIMQRIGICVSDILNNIADMDVRHEETAAVPSAEQNAVTAIVQFEGNYRGFVSLHCPETLALRIASGMRGCRQDSINDAVRTELGEVVYLLCSDVNLFLSPERKNLSLSPPFVFCGDDYYYDYANDPESLCCSFLHESERFTVGVKLKK
jgi:chemotaxis protein CheX